MLELRNNQVQVSGEIFGSSWDDPSTSTTQALTGTFARLGTATGKAGLETTFKSDRDGTVEIYVQAYIDKTSNGGIGQVRMRLVNGINSEISGTNKQVIEFHSSDGRQLVCVSWLMSVTKGTSYTIRPQIRRETSTQDFDVRWGDTDPAIIIKVIGL